MDSDTALDDAGCTIPPQVYDVAFGWDPAPEINRLLVLSREHGVAPRSALELGCGTGRLLAALRVHADVTHGIELNPQMAALARQNSGATIHVGDMSDFDLARQFDLIYASANTIQNVRDDGAIARLWRRVARHLRPGGVFIADLELGWEHITASVGKPARWLLSRGATLVHASWQVVTPPALPTRCCVIRWEFEQRDEGPPRRWSQDYPFRVFDADEFARFATAGGELELRGMYELRDPDLLPRPIERVQGRTLVVLRRAEGATC